MEQPLVSIVIPVYNVAPYLDRCLSSVAGQTYPNLEIILVDDGSPDACPRMCDAWAEKDGRFRVIHKANAGQGLARNDGLTIAGGEYCFFFDSDDYVEKNIVEECVRTAQCDGADAVLFGRWDVGPDGRKKALQIHAQQLLFSGNEICEKLLPKLFTYEMGLGVGACGRMYRMETLRSNGLAFVSEREIISEDAYFALQFFLHARAVSILPKNLYNYCQREDSFSHSFRRDKLEQNNRFLAQSLDYVKKHRLPAQVGTGVTVRYHAYTIGLLKQILRSDEPEKHGELLRILRDPELHRTLVWDVLKKESKAQAVFFLLAKLRLYGLCCRLLLWKVKRETGLGDR